MLTPRLSTADDGLTRADISGSSVVVSLASCCRVPSHTSCVFVGVHPQPVATHPGIDAFNAGDETLR